MPRRERRTDAAKQALLAPPLLQPRSMHTVTGAKDVATGNPFMRLHEIKSLTRQRTLDATRKRVIAPQAAEMRRGALDDGVLVFTTSSLACNQRQ